VGYVERHLLPDERVLYKTRVHWVVFVRPLLVVVAGLVAAALLRSVEQPAWAWMLGAALVVAALVWLLARVIEVQTSEFAVTSTRLILKVGLVWRYTTELLLSKVETIGVEQSLLGRVLNFGDLTVTGTGGARETFKQVRDPMGLRNHVQAASIALESARSRPTGGDP
jgi:uncharacterized membrane protein YdbT with pleckstrin-like domain